MRCIRLSKLDQPSILLITCITASLFFAPLAYTQEEASTQQSKAIEKQEKTIEQQQETIQQQEKTLKEQQATLEQQKQSAAEEKESAEAAQAKKEQQVRSTAEEMSKTLEALKAELEAQKQKIAELEARQNQETKNFEKQSAKQQETIKVQDEQLKTQRQATQSLQKQVDEIAAESERQLSDEDRALRSRLETLEESIQASQNAESTRYDIDSFQGSIAIPGTSAAMKIGGFVKVNVVASLDPIGTDDRFISGTIPVPYDGGGGTVSKLNASQSRLNLDLRDTTPAGPFRAFIEGDFDGNEETLRLRHAFGQYNDMLAGKTWTAFMDAEAIPEDLDFEGLNGRILARQAQLRFFPSIGRDWNMIFSIEDANPQIGGGEGVSKIPDIVLSVRRTWYERWHIKTALLFRNLDADCVCQGGASDNTRAWALTLSGKTSMDAWDERDNVLFQFSYGEGYSRYVNDMSSIDEPDAVFDLSTGKMENLPVFAGYMAFQKWWGKSTRSNLNIGYVEVDNLSYQQDDAYKSTTRMALNYIWSPTARVDVGGEILNGTRKNKDNKDGRAMQLQFAITYRY